MDDRDELARHDEERAAHAEHADERSLLVELVLDVRRAATLARAWMDRKTVTGSVECKATTDLVASSALPARLAGESRCRSTSRARRSATSDPVHATVLAA